MKIKEILHENTPGYHKQSPEFKLLIDIIHQLQEDVAGLMATDVEVARSVNSIASATSKNTTYRETGKYVTPAGRFKTYAAAANGNNMSTYMVKKLIKDEANLEYYIDLDNPTAIDVIK